jgi:hypothetical protein
VKQHSITFLMPVTDRDLIIADYAVRSYQLLNNSIDIPFKLLIYFNNVTAALKERYVARWKCFSYVDFIDGRLNEECANGPSADDEEDSQTARRYYAGALRAGRKAYRFEGPWERHDRILDRELKQIDSSLVASVDADFEILRSDFVQYILTRMLGNDNLKVMSSDYGATSLYETDAFGTGYCYLQERYHTWFCVYKRDVIDFPESHRYRDFFDEKSGQYHAWDTSAYFQKRLREDLGCAMESTEQFGRSFIHYSAFSKNRSIGWRNVRLYRATKIASKRPLLQQLWSYDERWKLLLRLDWAFSRRVAPRMLSALFNEAERRAPVYADQRKH